MNRFVHPLCVRVFSKVLSLILVLSLVLQPVLLQAQSIQLPPIGTVLSPTLKFNPVNVQGLTVHPENPFQFEFILDAGDRKDADMRQESMKLIKYFLTTLTVPDNEMWVNLSPVEKDRIIADGLGKTVMGQDLLALDYVLKQLTASLMNPDTETGKKFWERIYASGISHLLSGKNPNANDQIQDAIESFNKVWIVPAKASIYQKGSSAFIVENHLKVMLESDYLVEVTGNVERETGTEDLRYALPAIRYQDDVKQVIRDIILPVIEQEVNEGEAFANLRQIYNAMLLATWYKRNLKQSLLSQVYVNQNKVDPMKSSGGMTIEEIYNQYVESFKAGAGDLIKEEYDPETQNTVARKYFTGGLKNYDDAAMTEAADVDLAALIPPGAHILYWRLPVDIGQAKRPVWNSDNPYPNSEFSGTWTYKYETVMREHYEARVPHTRSVMVWMQNEETYVQYMEDNRRKTVQLPGRHIKTKKNNMKSWKQYKFFSLLSILFRFSHEDEMASGLSGQDVSIVVSPVLIHALKKEGVDLILDIPVSDSIGRKIRFVEDPQFPADSRAQRYVANLFEKAEASGLNIQKIQANLRRGRIQLVEMMRDSLQGHPGAAKMSVGKKWKLMRAFVRSGVASLEPTSYVHPKVEAMKNSDQLGAKLNRQNIGRNVRVMQLVLNQKGAERLLKANPDAREIALNVAAASSYGAVNNGAGSITQQMSGNITPTVRYIREYSKSISLRTYISNVWGYRNAEGKFEQVQLDDVIDLIRQLKALGIKEIVLSDTTGEATPDQVMDVVSVILGQPEFQGLNFAFHGHDRDGTGVLNVLAAIQAGITTIDTSGANLGGTVSKADAPGNISTEDVTFAIDALGGGTGVHLNRYLGVIRLMGRLLKDNFNGKNAMGLYNLTASQVSALKQDFQQRVQALLAKQQRPSTVIVEKDDNGNGWIRLNQPNTLNALSADLMDDILSALDELENDDSVHRIIMTGEGNAFMAGADLKARKLLGNDANRIRAAVARINKVADALAVPDKQTVVVLNGPAFGGGVELALAADYRIMMRNTPAGRPNGLSLTETTLAIIPGAGGTVRLPRLVGTLQAKKMTLQSKFVKADEALSMGLVDSVVDNPDDLDNAISKVSPSRSRFRAAAWTVSKVVAPRVPYHLKIETRDDGTAMIAVKKDGRFTNAQRAIRELEELKEDPSVRMVVFQGTQEELELLNGIRNVLEVFPKPVAVIQEGAFSPDTFSMNDVFDFHISIQKSPIVDYVVENSADAESKIATILEQLKKLPPHAYAAAKLAIVEGMKQSQENALNWVQYALYSMTIPQPERLWALNEFERDRTAPRVYEWNPERMTRMIRYLQAREDLTKGLIGPEQILENTALSEGEKSALLWEVQNIPSDANYAMLNIDELKSKFDQEVLSGLSQKHEDFYNEFRALAQDVIAIRAAKIDEKNDINSEEVQFIVNWLVEKGYVGLAFNEDDRDTISEVIITLLMAEASEGIALIYDVWNALTAFPLWYAGNEEQKKDFLDALLKGEVFFVFGLTERDGAGSNAIRGQKSNAKYDPETGTYTLNAKKHYITVGTSEKARYMIAFVDVDFKQPPKKEGEPEWVSQMEDPANRTGAFIVKLRDENGKILDDVTIDKQKALGHLGSGTAEVVLENIELTSKDVLGTNWIELKNQGVDVFNPDTFREAHKGKLGGGIIGKTLEAGRISISAIGLGAQLATIEETVRVYQERQESLSAAERLKWESEIQSFMADFLAGWRLIRKSAVMKDNKEKYNLEAGILKMITSETAVRNTLQAMRLIGEDSLVLGNILERVSRDNKLLTIGEGTTQTMRNLILNELGRKFGKMSEIELIRKSLEAADLFDQQALNFVGQILAEHDQENNKDMQEVMRWQMVDLLAEGLTLSVFKEDVSGDWIANYQARIKRMSEQFTQDRRLLRERLEKNDYDESLFGMGSQWALSIKDKNQVITGATEQGILGYSSEDLGGFLAAIAGVASVNMSYAEQIVQKEIEENPGLDDQARKRMFIAIAQGSVEQALNDAETFAKGRAVLKDKLGNDIMEIEMVQVREMLLNLNRFRVRSMNVAQSWDDLASTLMKAADDVIQIYGGHGYMAGESYSNFWIQSRDYAVRGLSHSREANNAMLFARQVAVIQLLSDFVRGLWMNRLVKGALGAQGTIESKLSRLLESLAQRADMDGGFVVSAGYVQGHLWSAGFSKADDGTYELRFRNSLDDAKKISALFDIRYKADGSWEFITKAKLEPNNVYHQNELNLFRAMAQKSPLAQLVLDLMVADGRLDPVMLLDVDPEAYPAYDEMKGKVMTLQGVGGVGGQMIEPLLNAGVKLIVSDVDAGKIEQFKAKYRSFIQAGQLFAFAEERVGKQYTNKIMNPLEFFPDLKATMGIEKIDVFVPAAVGKVLNDETIPMLQAAGVRAIVGSANDVYADRQKHSQMLHEMGIVTVPDYISNFGGVFGVDGFLLDQKVGFGLVAKTALKNIYNLLADAKKKGLSPLEVADALARNFFEGLPRKKERYEAESLNGAILKDGTRIKVYASKFELPEAVQERWDDHYAVFELTNEQLGYKSYVAIHRLTEIEGGQSDVLRGQYRATGGTRMRVYKNEVLNFKDIASAFLGRDIKSKEDLENVPEKTLEELGEILAMSDAMELGKEMSFKTAGAGLPIGGSKCTINVKIDPRDGEKDQKAKDKILISYAKAVEFIGSKIGGGVLTGQDMNISVRNAKLMFKYARTSIVPYVAKRFSIEPTPPTGVGVYNSIAATLKYLADAAMLFNNVEYQKKAQLKSDFAAYKKKAAGQTVKLWTSAPGLPELIKNLFEDYQLSVVLQVGDEYHVFRSIQDPAKDNARESVVYEILDEDRKVLKTGYYADEDLTNTILDLWTDAAMVAGEPTHGGIDLDGSKLEMDIQGEGSGIEFQADPAMLERLKTIDFNGLSPVILDIKPFIQSPLYSELFGADSQKKAQDLDQSQQQLTYLKED